MATPLKPTPQSILYVLTDPSTGARVFERDHALRVLQNTSDYSVFQDPKAIAASIGESPYVLEVTGSGTVNPQIRIHVTSQDVSKHFLMAELEGSLKEDLVSQLNTARAEKVAAEKAHHAFRQRLGLGLGLGVGLGIVGVAALATSAYVTGKTKADQQAFTAQYTAIKSSTPSSQTDLDALVTTIANLRAQTTQLGDEMKILQAQRDTYQADLRRVQDDQAAAAKTLESAQAQIQPLANIIHTYTVVTQDLKALPDAIVFQARKFQQLLRAGRDYETSIQKGAGDATKYLALMDAQVHTLAQQQITRDRADLTKILNGPAPLTPESQTHYTVVIRDLAQSECIAQTPLPQGVSCTQNGMQVSGSDLAEVTGKFFLSLGLPGDASTQDRFKQYTSPTLTQMGNPIL
ncbi:hypothetical protein HYV86_01415 [Candidatus Woesearchaeota archaeon]|nr:hypothetical protein [Candidatus Woesearchaeota archaeon]